jgi:hypothetical protein
MIGKASKTKLRQFGIEVNRFYEANCPPTSQAGEFRTYYGGLVAVNFSLQGKQQTFFNNLLYAHSTIVPDPIARWYFDAYEELAKTPAAEYLNGAVSADQSEWIGWMLSSFRAFQWNLRACRDVLAFFVSGLLTLRTLVEAGVVVLMSQAHILLAESGTIVQSALDDANDPSFTALCENPVDEQLPLWDNVRGGIMTPGNQPIPKDAALWSAAKEAAYHIRKNLLIAERSGGVYVPENKTDFSLLSGILRRAGKEIGCNDWDIIAAQSVKDLKVPSIEGLPLSELAAIRKDENAFQEFRVWLARKLMSAEARPEAALISLTSEEIEGEVSRLRERLSTSSVIKERLKQDGISIAVQTTIGIITGGHFGAPVLGATAGALAGIASALLTRDRGAVSILAKLARMNRSSPDATLGKAGIVKGVPRALAQPFFGEFRTGPKPVTSTAYTRAHLRKIVEASLKPNTTGNPFKAIPSP